MLPASGNGSAENCHGALADSRFRTKPGPATTAPPSGRPATLVGQRGGPGRRRPSASTAGSIFQPDPSSTETPPLGNAGFGVIRCQVVIASLPAKATEVKTGGVCGGWDSGGTFAEAPPGRLVEGRDGRADGESTRGVRRREGDGVPDMRLGVGIGSQAPVAWLQVHIPPSMPTA